MRIHFCNRGMQGDLLYCVWYMDESWRNWDLSGNGRGLAGEGSVDSDPLPQP